jgi:DNA repair photolyase
MAKNEYIYETRGFAKEYAPLAVNIYTGCPHGCWYCSVPGTLKKNVEDLRTDIRPRKDIVNGVRRQLEKENFEGELVHLCFTCDPYPTGYDSAPTREIIKLLKAHGAKVQILTKGRGARDFDLLDDNDWYGVTIDGSCSGSVLEGYISDIRAAKAKGIHTWVSFEPVIDTTVVLDIIKKHHKLFDKVKIGRLNHFDSDADWDRYDGDSTKIRNIDWKKFGNDAVKLCESVGLEYYIKKTLRAAMEG